MKTSAVQIRYQVDTTVKQMLTILKRDWYAPTSKRKTLRGILEAEFSVTDIEYDGHFGAHVWYTVDVKDDKPELHKEIQQAIRKYAK